ncbi:hypothetical protein FIBSPDRAFT_350151 [Athelia psychrophila]|uniref:Uncharacterized protein n=1 Tax=Athelia psychrophila TaxID=1759441 RepID=A0A167VXU7_9AGAM|nr:hypothetical protein FIBSPDRAFT_350151 [Fibularhizoctonia sp. CBS 109695]
MVSRHRGAAGDCYRRLPEARHSRWCLNLYHFRPSLIRNRCYIEERGSDMGMESRLSSPSCTRPSDKVYFLLFTSIPLSKCLSIWQVMAEVNYRPFYRISIALLTSSVRVIVRQHPCL